MKSINVGQKKLRMLCDRALRVYERNESVHPAIGSLGTKLVPAVQAYISAYDASHLFQPTRNSEMDTGRSKVTALYKQIRTWIPILEHDVVGFSSSQLYGNPDSPDLVIGDALRLIAAVEERKDSLPYAETLLTDVRDAMAVAQTEWADAQAALVAQQQLQKQVREFAAVAHTELVSFRKVLRAVLGQSHRDYQVLRSTRIKQTSEETEEVSEVIAIDPTTKVAKPLINGRTSSTVPFSSELGAVEGASN